MAGDGSVRPATTGPPDADRDSAFTLAARYLAGFDPAQIETVTRRALATQARYPGFSLRQAVEEEVIAALWAAVGRRIIADVTARWAGSGIEAEDVLAEASERYLRRLRMSPDATPIAHATGYLWKLARNVAANEFRRISRHPVSLLPESADGATWPAEGTEAERAELERALAEALTRFRELDPVAADAFEQWADSDGATAALDRIAADLGVSPRTVRRRIAVAQAFLRRWLAPWIGP